MALLMAHSWPGNVRELRNVLERGVIVASGNTLQANDLGLTPAPTGQRNERNGLASLEDMERRHIAEVLQRTGGDVSQAARILDVDRGTLYSKIRKYQLRKEDAE
jgi:DNA-binding NtrC family response regulator